jgi:alpha-galactosidase
MPEVSLRHIPAGPVLENEALRLAVRLDDGTFSLGHAEGRDEVPPAGGLVIPSAWTGVALSDGPSLTSRGAGFDVEREEPVEDAHGRGRALTLSRRAAADEPHLALTLALYEEQPFAVLQSRLANTTGRPLRVQAFHVVQATLPALKAAPADWRFYKHGSQSWSPTLTLSADDDDIAPFPPVVDLATRPQGQGLVSDLVGALSESASGRTITAGFVSAADQFSQVWLGREDATLTATSYADDIELAAGAELSSERAVIDITRHPLSALVRYGDALAGEMRGLSWPHIPTGWCSWYYYFQAIREDGVVANLERLADLRDELPLEYVQVDDGYQAGIGDWLTVNEKFPHGMAWLAGRIHERGFKAGLWLAPFLAGARSRLFAEHPDWVVRDEAGEPVVAIQNWEQLCYALDCTRPEVIDWLEHVFGTVTEGWGYDYVKIDFIYAAAVNGIRHERNVTRAQAYRRGLEAIRRAVGDRFVLGCGAPIGPSIGLVNGMRIGPDVAPLWHPQARLGRRISLSLPATVNALRNAVTRFWMHNRLWLNDPDCLLLRESETDLTPDEVRTLATVIAMSGGMILDSDDLTRLSPERRGLLARLLPLQGAAAVPLDMFERGLPQVLWRASDGLLAVVNWADEATDVRVRLPLPAARLTDFWTGEDYGVHQGEATFRRLPPHASKLLLVSRLED